MVNALYSCFHAELLKSRRTVTFWMVVAGAFFTPAIITGARVIQFEALPRVYASPVFWTAHWRSSWESMALFLLPLGVIMITSLLTQLEYRNNTWKQLHTLPVPFTAIFLSKLLFIILMVVMYLFLFNVGIITSGIIPWLLVSDVPLPRFDFSSPPVLRYNLLYFVDCLPIVALQYWLCLRYKNVLVPIGAGFLLWVGALASLSWKYGYLTPYIYGMYTYLDSGVANKAIIPNINVHILAIVYFLIFTTANYAGYLTKDERG